MKRHKVIVIALLASATVLCGGLASASVPDAGTNIFHGCVNKSSGELRIIDPAKSWTAGHCVSSETAITWNQAGVQGAPGTPGKDGTNGVAGPPGRDGTNGIAGPAGKDGTNGLAGAPGKDGAEGPPGKLADQSCTTGQIVTGVQGGLITCAALPARLPLVIADPSSVNDVFSAVTLPSLPAELIGTFRETDAPSASYYFAFDSGDAPVTVLSGCTSDVEIWVDGYRKGTPICGASTDMLHGRHIITIVETVGQPVYFDVVFGRTT